MPHSESQRLADLEELALRIPNQSERQYFNEAVQCYFSGSLRAAIILAWIVATDNLLGKLELLANEDGEARKRFVDIKTKRDNDQSYEEDLLNSFGPKVLDVFTPRELEQLNYVRQKRHWCAHATDYRPTPEEARTCLRLVVDITLSKPTFRGHAYIKQLESEIKDPAFLPDKGYESVVANYLRKLRPELHIRIVQKLIDLALDSSATSTTKENVSKFIGGLLEHTNDEAQIQRIAVELARAINASADLVRGTIVHKPDAYRHLEFEHRERLFRFILQGGLNDEDQNLLVTFLQIERALGNSQETLKAQLKDKILSLPHLVKQNPTEFSDAAFDVVTERLEYLGSNNYYVNNAAATFLSTVGFETFNGKKPEEKERLLRALAISAFDGAKIPRQLLLNTGSWPENWLEILVTTLPGVLTVTYLTSSSYELFAAPLIVWAQKGKPLPKGWLPLLVPKASDDRTPSWYGSSDKGLLKQLENIDKAFADNGNPSVEMRSFIEWMKKDIEAQTDDIPF
jgi:hypothetical protein